MFGRLTVAGWAWLTYAAAVAAFVVSCSGCAAAPAAPAAGPRPGAVCALQLQGRQVRAVVIGQAHGLVDVRTDAPGWPVLLVAPGVLQCGGAS